MKIAILGSKDYDSLEFHLNDELENQNYEVFHICLSDIINIPYGYQYIGIKYSQKISQYIFGEMANRIIDFKPDLILCTYRFIHPTAIIKLKRKRPNAIIAHINPDQLTTIDNQQIFISPYDAYFSKDPFIVDFMSNKLGLNTFYLPEAFNPRIHHANGLNLEDCRSKHNIDVAVFGSIYPYRQVIIERLIAAGLNLRIFGTPDRRFKNSSINKYFNNEFITGSKKAEILLGSKIIFNNFHYAEVYSANVKYFEIFGIGAFQICDYKPTLIEYSAVNPDKYSFKSTEQAIKLIEYYLKHNEERKDLAKIQQEHFLKNHTYKQRIHKIFSCLDL